MDGSPDVKWGVVEPTEQTFFTNDLLISKTLVDLYRDHIPVQVLNLSSEPRKIKCGTEMASCKLVSSVINSSEHEQINKLVTLMELPGHLKQLYEKSVISLDSQEKEQVLSLLIQNADVFCTGPNDLGCTDLIKHTIYTGDSAPIRQAPRQLPLKKREEAHLALKNMEQQGVVEPSTSPWSSPIVLVT